MSSLELQVCLLPRWTLNANWYCNSVHPVLSSGVPIVLSGGYLLSYLGVTPCPFLARVPSERTCNRTLDRSSDKTRGTPPPRKDMGPEAEKGPWTRGQGTPPLEQTHLWKYNLPSYYAGGKNNDRPETPECDHFCAVVNTCLMFLSSVTIFLTVSSSKPASVPIFTTLSTSRLFPSVKNAWIYI